MNNNNFPLSVALFDITLKVSAPVTLPEYPGSSLRGMIKKSLLNNWEKFYNGFNSSEKLFWIDAFYKSSHLPRPYGIIVNPIDVQSKTINDTFVFGIALYGNAIQFWQRLIEQIDWWGGQYNDKDKGLWNGNFSVQKVNCRTNGQLLFENKKFTGISPYYLTMNEASSISRYLHFNTSVKLLFKAPLWLRGKDNNRWVEYDKFDLNLFTYKVSSHANRLNRTYTTHIKELSVPSLKDVQVSANCKPVSWAVYSNKGPEEVGQQEFIRGIKGQVIIKGNIEELSTLLLFGSWIGVGKGTTQGLGFYQLVDSDHNEVLSDELFEQVITIENLQKAYDEIITDDVDDENIFENNIDIYQIQSHLKQGQYKSTPLRGVVIPKANGSFRFLAVPNQTDRIIQRAVLQVITPLLETTFELSSHGYRIARSRYTAARQLDKLRTEGYKFVVDADITNFFDTVKHDILLNKLKLIIHDKKVLDLIKSWITADVLFNKKRLRREYGLPQGMSLSPILANVYLDKFDETIEKHGIKLVRYADDFIMLCRQKEQLLNAKKIAEEALDEIKLKISDEKTNLTSFDEGFDYLGFLFFRSVIIEKEKKEKKIKPLPISKEDVIAELSRLGYEKVVGRKSTYFNKIQIKSNDSFLRTIWLMTPGSKASKSMGHLQVRHYGAELLSLPLSQVEQIIVAGSVSLSPGLIQTCLRNNVPLIFISHSGKYQGRLSPGYSNSIELWEKQLQKSNDENFCLLISKELIKAKLSNTREIVRRHKKTNDRLNRLWDDLGEQGKRLKRANTIDEIRGVEGKASALYFDKFRFLINEKFKFRSRNRRPPIDPVNVLLSFGYTILHANIYSLIEKSQLSPFLGFMHQRRAGHAALASDIIEPFRFLVDQTVIRCINRNQLQPKHFYVSNSAKIPCQLSNVGRRIFIAEIENKLTETVLIDNKKADWRRIMDLQIYHLRKQIEDIHKEEWRAFRLRS